MNWMQRAVARRYDNDGGFTLIELMIVILILGILAAAVVLGIGAFQNSGKHEACQTSARELEAAAAAYYAKNPGNYGTIADYEATSPPLIHSFSNPWGLSVSATDGSVDDSVCPS
jgi:prepilin-type N-terminal cleavage/methylation domain-containing protein